MTFDPSIHESILNQFPHGPGGFSMKFRDLRVVAGDFQGLVVNISDFERRCALATWTGELGISIPGKFE